MKPEDQPASSISRYSFLLFESDNRASRYLRLMASWAGFDSACERIRALPANSGPATLPRMLQAATLTLGLLRMRLDLPESIRVFTYSLSSRPANQTGVPTPTPLFRKVVRQIYFCP